MKKRILQVLFLVFMLTCTKMVVQCKVLILAHLHSNYTITRREKVYPFCFQTPQSLYFTTTTFCKTKDPSPEIRNKKMQFSFEKNYDQNDTVVKKRLMTLQQINNMLTKLTTAIIKGTKISKNYSRSIKQRELKRDFAINRSWKRLEHKKIKMMHKTLPVHEKTGTKVQPTEKDLQELHVRLFEREYDMEELREKLDSCLMAVKNLVTNDAMLNDSLAFKNEIFTGMLQAFMDTIAQGNEQKIQENLKMIITQYNSIETSLSHKNVLMDQLPEINRIVNVYIADAQSTYIKNQKDILQLYNYSNSLSDTIVSLYKNSQQQLANLYQLAIAYQKHLLHNNQLQEGFIRTNLDQVIVHKRLAKKVKNSFAAWYKVYYENKSKSKSKNNT